MQAINESNIHRIIRGHYALVNFYSNQCIPCRVMKKQLREVEKKIKTNKFIIGAVDIDTQPELDEKYQIDAIPTLILFKDGVEIGRSEGRKNFEQIKEFIKECLI